MKNLLEPKLCMILCKTTGLGLLFAYWVKSGETTGFFLLLFLVVMMLLRWRVPKAGPSVLIDFIVCAALFVTGELPVMIAAFPLFETMVLGYAWSAIGLVYIIIRFDAVVCALFVLIALCGFFLYYWERERREKRLVRDVQAGRYYELEQLQSDLVAALAQIEQMTAVHERARIARDIHDNAGHEIIAAYMSLQAVKSLLPTDQPELTTLFNAALDRLDAGTHRIREAVHNLGTVTFYGVERLHHICKRFLPCAVAFKVYGDTSNIPIYVWSMLESCLGEALTNIARHAQASWIRAQLDATPYIVRMCIENDGIRPNEAPPGNGLRNLRYRAAAIGGSLSVDSGAVFRVICVIPIRVGGEEQ